MTREQAREALWMMDMGDSNWIITKIFNDHEAQLKAKDEEIERLKTELYYEETAVRSIKDL